MAASRGISGRSKAKPVRTKDVAPLTWVRVARPEGATADLPVEMVGWPGSPGMTGTAFSITPSELVTFRARQGGRLWATEAECLDLHPRNSPQRIVLSPVRQAGIRQVARSQADAASSNLVVKAATGRARRPWSISTASTTSPSPLC
jgi:hypothetical protein